MDPHRRDDSRRRSLREAKRRRLRVERLTALLVLAAVCSFSAVYFLVMPALRSQAKHPGRSAAVTDRSASALSPSPSPTDNPSAAANSPTPATAATDSPRPESNPPPRPSIKDDPIDFGSKRRAEMAAYSRRRYGDSTVHLDPKVIVLHYTAGGTYQSAWSLFNSDQPNMGEKPGTVTHFIVDKDGAIYQLLPLDVRGRHTVGLNHVAIGIEFVQDAGSGDTWATGQILRRSPQIRAGIELVRWLQYRFDIKTKNVIGHGTANDSPFFKDLAGLTNDHGDWGSGPIRSFHKRLRAAAAP